MQVPSFSTRISTCATITMLLMMVMTCSKVVVAFSPSFPSPLLSHLRQQTPTTTIGFFNHQRAKGPMIQTLKHQQQSNDATSENENGNGTPSVRDEKVNVGTKEYYAGFLSRDLEEAEERVAGDKVLIPTLKFVGGFTVVILSLLVGFMASNGLL